MLKVKIFDEAHEKDLETDINNFIRSIDAKIKNVEFRTAITMFGDEQIYCFSALILYEDE